LNKTKSDVENTFSIHCFIPNHFIDMTGFHVLV
jgi:hypothetical protein